MGKKILSLGLLFLMAACSPSGKQASESEKPDLILESQGSIITGAANFGTFEALENASKVLTFKIINEGPHAITGAPSIDNAKFSLTYSNCPSTLAAGKNCNIKVAFSSKGLQPGEHTGNLNYDSVFVALSATINQAPVSETSSAVFNQTSGEISSVDFGQISEKQNVLKTFTIKNNGTSPITSNLVINGGYTLSYDACSNKTLNKNGTCTFKVSFSGAGKSGVIAGNLTYDGKSLPLTGEVVTSASGGNSSMSPNVVFLNQNNLTSNFDFGIMSGTDSKQAIFNVKNTGTLATPVSTAALASSDNFSIIYNQCANTSLAINASCQVRVLFAASGKAESVYTTSLNFGTFSLPIKATVSASSCPSNEHLEGGNCFANIRSCSSEELSSLSQYAVSGNATWNGSSYVCTIAQCQDHYLLGSNSCSPIMFPVVVTPAVNGYISGASSGEVLEGTVLNLVAQPNSGYLFTSWGGDAASCGSNTNCSLVVTQGINISATFTVAMCSLSSSPNLDLENILAVSGTGNNCSIVSCKSGYALASDQLSCEENPLLANLQFKNIMNSFSKPIKLRDGSTLWMGQGTTYHDPNGKIWTVPMMVKVNPQGYVDEQFLANLGSGFNSFPWGAAEDNLGNLYIVGSFTSFQGIANNANRIAKLNKFGVFDTTFSNNLDVVSGVKAADSGLSAEARVVVLNAAQDAIYVGGQFSQFKNNPNNANRVVKLSTSGVFNSTFSDNLDASSGVKTATSGIYRISGTAYVYVMEIDADNNLYIGGTFDSFKGVNNSARNIVKLNSNGVFDVNFSNNLDVTPPTKTTNSGFNNTVRGIILNSGNLYVTGDFTQFKNTSNNARGLAKMSSGGVFDLAFSNNLDIAPPTKSSNSGLVGLGTPSVYDAKIKNNYLYVGGNFTAVKGSFSTNNARGLARFTLDGVFDQSFSDLLDIIPGTKAATSGLGGSSNYVSFMHVEDDRLIFTGSVSTYKGKKIQGSTTISLTTGNLLNYSLDFSATQVNTIARDSLGNLYLGGVFTEYKGVPVGNIMKLKPNGDLDMEFNNNVGSGFNSAVNSLIVRGDQLYVGGQFNNFNGITNNARFLARLSLKGVFDQSFSDSLDVVPGTKAATSGFNSTILTMAHDGTYLYVGGGFTGYKGGTNNARFLAKMTTAGVLDEAFSNNADVVSGVKANNSGFNSQVSSIALSGTDLFVGGNFTQFKDVMYNARYVAKVSTSGVFNQEFSDNLDIVSGVKASNSGFHGQVMKMLVHNNSVYVGGFFGSFKGFTTYNAKTIAKLSLSGVFNQEFSDNLDVVSGVKDSSTSGFSGTGGGVYDMAIDPVDNKLIVVGGMSGWKGVANKNNRIAKLSYSGVYDEAFSDNLDMTFGVKAATSGFSGALITTVLVDGSMLYLGGTFTGYQDQSSEKFKTLKINGENE